MFSDLHELPPPTLTLIRSDLDPIVDFFPTCFVKPVFAVWVDLRQLFQAYSSLF